MATIAVITVLAAACSGDPGRGLADAAANDAQMTDGGVPADGDVTQDGSVDPDGSVAPDAGPITAPTQVSLTEGGGSTGSTGYRAQVFIGAPQPFGDTASPSFRLRLGPNSN